MIQVLYVTAECAPFIKAGGLGDVASSLPAALTGCNVHVVLPYYSCLDAEQAELSFFASFSVDFEGDSRRVRMYRGKWQGIFHYFLQAPDYFTCAKPYDGDCGIETRRFAFFACALMAALPSLGYQPDIIHLNDWHTGPIAAMIYYLRQHNAFFQNMKTVFTIHNLRYQGVCDRNYMQYCTRLPDEVFNTGGMAWYNWTANPMRCGIYYADRVTTVSERYAQEIQWPEYGEGLYELLRERSAVVSGIINGLDYREFSPEEDRYLPFRYNAETVKKGKAYYKEKLQRDFGLRVDPNAFLAASISRLTDQKGIDLIAAAAERLISRGAQVIITGDGDDEHTRMVNELAQRFPGRIGAYPVFNEPFSRQLYAGSDVLLMPSRFEPCGLSQLIAMRYGTVPVVRWTGGLRDTVTPCAGESGLGFVFEDYSVDALDGAFSAAERLYNEDRRSWNALVQRDMNADFSWDASAVRYQALYEGLVSGE